MRLLSALIAVVCLTASSASAATIAAYRSVNGDFISANEQAFGVTALDLTRGGGLVEAGNANRFRSRGFEVGADLSGAVAAGDFISFGFTSTEGFDLDGLSVRLRVNDNGPSQIQGQISVDGGAFVNVGGPQATSTTAATYGFDLSGFTDVDDFQFRVVGLDAAADNGRLILTNTGALGGNSVLLVGEVPLPAAGGLLLLALSGAHLIRRRA